MWVNCDLYVLNSTIIIAQLSIHQRACVLDHTGSWEEHLPLMEFAYNNSYQASIQMAPYEALYGRPCRSPICWTEVGESSIIGPDPIRDTSDKVSLIRQRLLTA